MTPRRTRSLLLTQRLVLVALVACLFVLLLLQAGCRRDTGDAPGGVTRLTYWRTLTGPGGEAQDALVARFNAAHPDIEVSSEFQGGYADLAAKLMTAAAAGDGPDVTQLGTFEIREFARSGLLVDLRRFMLGEGGLDTSGWPGTLRVAGEVDGAIYWLPFNVSVPVLYYNEDAFEAAGLDGPPQTWDAFFVQARELSDPETGRAGVAFWNITWPFVSMIWSEGGELTDRQYENITLDDPIAIAVMERVQALVRDGAAIVPTAAEGGHRAAFQSGRAAMILDSPAGLAELTANSDFPVGVAPYPAGEAGRVYAPGGGGIAMLSRVPEAKREAAWAFMKHMLSPESIAYFAEQSGYVAFSEGARAEAADWLAGEDIAALHEALPHVRGDFSINMAPPVREAFDSAFLAIVMKDAPVAETLAEADARAEQAMAAGAEK